MGEDRGLETHTATSLEVIRDTKLVLEIKIGADAIDLGLLRADHKKLVNRVAKTESSITQMTTVLSDINNKMLLVQYFIIRYDMILWIQRGQALYHCSLIPLSRNRTYPLSKCGARSSLHRSVRPPVGRMSKVSSRQGRHRQGHLGGTCSEQLGAGNHREAKALSVPVRHAVAYGSWFDHVKGWWEKRKDHRILYLFYEDMKEDPKREIQKVMQFMEMELGEEILERIVQHTTFKEMSDNLMTNRKSTPPSWLDQKTYTFMRKGITGDWKNHFTVAQSERFDEEYERNMTGTSLHFIF
ncbi:hypothetical protein NDU88_003638 [Pleurodeles waltl]|uniref:Sulfotransferase n=1 Tax=Pleurodeles waltl TaxID=8319 RepID=A0AAV7PHH0_PLEWA|nr:hypothetical protein NDU88_003638 [Pleurodeles waltl]